MSKRLENTMSLKEAIDKLLSTYNIASKMDEISIQKEWEKLMSPAIVKRTQNIRLKNGMLHVQIESSVLRHELGFMKDKIINKFNKQLGKRVVKEILFF